MSDLRRQKEKLEEKIMEQYKRYDPVKKKYVIVFQVLYMEVLDAKKHIQLVVFTLNLTIVLFASTYMYVLRLLCF